jgi:hypothetical protein
MNKKLLSEQQIRSGDKAAQLISSLELEPNSSSIFIYDVGLNMIMVYHTKHVEPPHHDLKNIMTECKKQLK